MSGVTRAFNARASQTAREASIESKRERVTSFANKQFERCERQWTNQYYDRLLKREGSAPTLQPSYAVDDRKAHLIRAAERLAHNRLHRNVQRIDRVANRMMGRKRDELERG